MTLTTLALGLLAAAGAHWLIHWLEQRNMRPAARSAVRAVVAAVLVGAILVEGSGSLALARVSPPPDTGLAVDQPHFHLPSDVSMDSLYMYWSTESFPPVANGYSGFVPRSLAQLRALMNAFPDQQSVAALRSIGVHTVVLHPDLASGTPWQDVASRSIQGLPITRREVDGVVVYDILEQEP
jgi:hypothetical protein